VTSYYPWLELGPFAFFLTFEDLLDCLEYERVGPFHCPVGLRLVYRGEGNLRSDLLTKILEHCTVKILGIVNCDMSGNTIETNDILPKELFDDCGAYVCDRFCLNPLREVLDCHNGEGTISFDR
jgi:hypothetical protein